jgi:Tfp pilus assembly protein PilP
MGNRVFLVALAAVLAAPLASPLFAQAAGTTDPQSTIQQDLQEILEEPATTDTYRYEPQGRRDPFRSLIGPSPKISRENAPPGPPGFMIDEIDLQGVFQTRQGLVAMVRGPDNNGYSMRVGDKVYDGEVIRITPSSIVFRQEVNDPTRIERYREVVKELTSQGERRG